ncbi:MAG: YihY/virulence factor BrkB family protein [Ignavibacteria bacterium]|nr:YihY/virulence factor BrkB family protein [Ignavibacteria bacterium]
MKRSYKKIYSIFKKAYSIIIEFGERLSSNHIFLLSSGIAFNILFCIIPLLLVAMGILGSLIDPETIGQTINRIITDSLPPNQFSSDMMSGTLAELQTAFHLSSIAGWIGAFALLWTSSALFSSLRTGLNAIFNISTERFFLVYKFQDILLTLVLLALLLASTLVAPIVEFVSSAGENVLPSAIFSWISGATIHLIGLASSMVFFFFLYRFIPNKMLPRWIVFMATAICTSLWEVARFGFSWYLTNLGSFGKLYGVYAIIVTIAVWIYYSSLITLISAEAAKFWYEKRGGEKF